MTSTDFLVSIIGDRIARKKAHGGICEDHSLPLQGCPALFSVEVLTI
jgi:hypothetical protein